MAGGRKGRTPREEDSPGWRFPSVPKLWAEVGGPAAAPGSWPRAQHQDESRVSSWGATPPPWGTFLSTRAPRVPAHAGVEMGAHAYVPVVIDQTASLSVSVTCVLTEKTGRPQAGRFRQKQGSEPVFRLCSPGAGTRPRSPVTYWCASEPGCGAGGEVWAPAFPPSGRPCVLALGVPGGAGRGAGGWGAAGWASSRAAAGPWREERSPGPVTSPGPLPCPRVPEASGGGRQAASSCCREPPVATPCPHRRGPGVLREPPAHRFAERGLPGGPGRGPPGRQHLPAPPLHPPLPVEPAEQAQRQRGARAAGVPPGTRRQRPELRGPGVGAAGAVAAEPGRPVLLPSHHVGSLGAELVLLLSPGPTPCQPRGPPRGFQGPRPGSP